MKFGYALCSQYLLKDDPVPLFAEQLDQVRLARDLGFSSVWTHQHYLSQEFQYLHQIPVLGRIAGEAGDMRIGTAITLSALENPVALAEQFATLDVISEGRLTVGLGLGYRDVEFDAFGVPKGRRLHRFLENLEIMLQVWTQESVTYEGDVVRLEGAGSALKPVQRPHPPIWLGGHTEGAIRRAVSMGFPWIAPAAHVDFDFLQEQVAIYRDAWKAEHDDHSDQMELPVVQEMYVARDEEEAVEDVRESMSAKYAAYHSWGQDSILPASQSFDKEFDDLRKNRFIVGDVEDCTDRLVQLIDEVEPTEICLRMQWPGMPHDKVMASMELLWSEVIPAAMARVGR